MLIRDASGTWSDPITLPTDEIWQTRSGLVFITTTPNPEPDDGFCLSVREGVLIRAGRQVRYRREDQPGDDTALIVREAV